MVLRIHVVKDESHNVYAKLTPWTRYRDLKTGHRFEINEKIAIIIEDNQSCILLK